MIEFFVPGRPAPQGSKTFKGTRNGRGIMVESSKELAPWRERVALAAHQAMQGRPMYSGVALQARYDFVFPRRASEPKRTAPMIQRPDGDKLERAINDALTGVVFTDDAAVVEWGGSKRRAEIDETPGVHIAVVPVVPHPQARITGTPGPLVSAPT